MAPGSLGPILKVFATITNIAMRNQRVVFEFLVLGDSHTQGFEVRQEATFSSVLGEQLRASGLDAEVLNTGISGFSTAEELMFLKHEGMKYHPDAVIVAFYGNDFEDNIKSGLYRLDAGKLIVQKTQHTPGVSAIRIMNAVPGFSWLSQNSYFFSLCVNTVWTIAKQALRTNAHDNIEYTARISSVDEYQKNLTLALLKGMKDVSAAAHVPLIVVDIPEPTSSGWSPSIPNDMMRDVAKLADAYVPASSYLTGMPSSDVHVPHGQRHISEMTHKRIADALNRVLRDLWCNAIASAAQSNYQHVVHLVGHCLWIEYTARISSVDEYQKNLTLALLKGMKDVSAAAHVPLIVVDIPEPTSSGWSPSIPNDMMRDVAKLADAYVPASSYLTGIPSSDVHVPHGDRHISEMTHKRIADALNRVLRDLWCNAIASAAQSNYQHVVHLVGHCLCRAQCVGTIAQ